MTLLVLGLSVLSSLLYHWQKWKVWEADWRRLGPIEARGGLHFPARVELKVPHFRQGDPRWKAEKLGNTPDTLAAVGCAVASAAMVLSSYGIDTDPGRLNHLLTDGDGYEGEGWIRWEKAAELTGNIAEKAYEDLPSYELIDRNLQMGNPVIVRLRAKDNTTHFVVIAGKDGLDYLALDPGAPEGKGLYPLREYGSKIEALRFYRRLK